MKPVNIGTHSAYQDHVLEQLCKYYPDAAGSHMGNHGKILELDLSDVDSIMQDCYSD